MAVETLLYRYLGKSVDCFTVVGVVVTACVILKATASILSGLWTYFLSGLFGLSFNFKKVGSWAVVTGCTEGIGRAYAENLARRGINVALISLVPSELQLLAEEIQSRFKVQTKAIVADFTKTDIYDNIQRQLSGLDIGTLVNNVGKCYEHPEFFLQLKNREKLTKDIITCNTMAVSMMTSIVLPDMVAKKRGVIINIASNAGRQPIPLLTVYSATKAFVIFFSRCLQAEYQSSGIIVQAVTPNFVATKMSKLNTTSFFVPTPEVFVRNALATVGLQSYTHGYWRHATQDKIANCFPEFIFWKILLHLRAEGQKMESDSRKKE